MTTTTPGPSVDEAAAQAFAGRLVELCTGGALTHLIDVGRRTFRAGGGVAYGQYLPELHDVMDALWGPIYDHLLVDAIVPLAPGLRARLAGSARVADVACGTERAVVNLAAAYSASRFVGYDLDPPGLERDQALAAAGFGDVEVRDAPGGPGNALFVATRGR